MQALYRMCISEISPGCSGAYESCSNWHALSASGDGHNRTFPKTAKGNMYVLIIGDYFTKWVEAYPMSDMEATTIAKCLYDYICCFGAPDMLHTDQGRNFESALISELCKSLGITKTRTTLYHPQSDRMIECFNRTLLSMLSMVLGEEGEENWEVALLAVMLAYRSSPHQTTHQSPFMLTFGKR